MVIDTRHVPEQDPAAAFFTRGLVEQLCTKSPEHRFLLITGKGRPPFLQAPNIESLSAGPLTHHPLRTRLWLHVQLPSLVKKWKADRLLFINSPCSGAVSIPQWQLFTLVPDTRKKKRSGRSCPGIVFSAAAREIAGEGSAIIKMVPPAVSGPFAAADFTARQEVKQQYTGGKEFFFYAGPGQPSAGWISLLKAFSIFKKRQQSGMRLVLPGLRDTSDRSLLKSISTYKFREELLLTGALSLPERARLMAAAYAVIGPLETDTLGLTGLEAARSGVPLIAAAPHPLLGPDAFLEAEMQEPVDLAAKMMQLYKDESLRNALTERAALQTASFNMEQTVAACRRILLEEPA